jgi:hypothetical protein
MDAVAGVVSTLPTFDKCRQGYLYEGDMYAAEIITKNVFRCTTTAFEIGVKMRGRRIEYALKP